MGKLDERRGVGAEGVGVEEAIDSSVSKRGSSLITKCYLMIMIKLGFGVGKVVGYSHPKTNRLMFGLKGEGRSQAVLPTC